MSFSDHIYNLILIICILFNNCILYTNVKLKVWLKNINTSYNTLGKESKQLRKSCFVYFRVPLPWKILLDRKSTVFGLCKSWIGKSQRIIYYLLFQGKRVQKCVETLDELKVSNARIKPVVVTTKWETFDHIPSSTTWEIFDWVCSIFFFFYLSFFHFLPLCLYLQTSCFGTLSISLAVKL